MRLEGMQIGPWQLRHFLGSGALGEVYCAEHQHRAHPEVAVKILKNEGNLAPGGQTSDDALRLFWHEMRAVAALAHPHIVPLFDFGEQKINAQSYTYIAMLFCPEGSLLDWLRQRNSPTLLSSQETIQIVRQAADAVQYAHNMKILHLHIKPYNFLMRYHADSPLSPNVLLADLGIAKFLTVSSTASQTIRGTPLYIAPEQWAGAPVAATDQYALAIIAYQLLTGKSPFEGPRQQLMYEHLYEPPQPPSVFNPQISPDVDSVILRALAKKPEDRFPSIKAFATAFEQARGE
jgi:serine/threonine protein kinase